MFIINVDPHYKGGSHWCSVYKYGPYFYLYDSFNRKAGQLSKYWKQNKLYQPTQIEIKVIKKTHVEHVI